MSFEEWFSKTHILSEDDKLGAFAGWTAALENTSRVVEFDLTDQSATLLPRCSANL